MPTNGTVHQKSTSIFDEMDAVVLRPPSWILRSGLGMIGIATCIMLVLSWFIQFPDTLQATAVITTPQKPIALVAKKEGIVRQIIAKQATKLEANAPILYYGDFASLYQVQLAKSWAMGQDWSVMPQALDSLGMLASAWLQLQVAWQNYTDHSAFAHPKLTLRQLDKQENLTTKLQRIDAAQTAINEAEYALIEQDYLRNKQLYTDKVISLKEFEASALASQTAKKQKTGMRAGGTEKDLRLNQLKVEKQRLLKDFQFKQIELKERLREQAVAFVIACETWDAEHILRAPASGIIQLQHEVQQSAMITPNQPVGYLIQHADTTQSCIALCQVPHARSGDMRVGNKVRLYLDAYAQEEYGILDGIVEQIQPVAISSKEDPNLLIQEVTVLIPAGYKTSTGKTLLFRPNMTARAEVVVSEKCLLQRLFGRFVSHI